MTWPTNPSSRTKFTTGQRKLGEVCEIISPGIKKFEGIKKYVATADVDFDKIVNFSEITYSNRPSRANMETKENDALVARMAETKKFLVVSKELQNNYIFSTGFAVLRTKKDLLPKCLFYFLTTKDFNLQKNKLAVGATQKAINNPALKRIKIPILPLPIQQKIVERLDAIKKAQELNDKQIALADELFQSLLHRELDSRGKNWEVRALGDLFEITSSKRVFESEWKKQGIPFYRAREIVSLVNNQALRAPIFISEQMFREYSKKYGAPKEGDILVTGVGTIGISYLVKKNDKLYFKDGNIIWLKRTSKSNIISEFVEYFFQTPFFKRQINIMSAGATVLTYTIQNAKRTKIPLPPIKTQRKIVEKLSSVQEYKKKLLEQKQKLQELFDSVLNKSFKEN